MKTPLETVVLGLATARLTQLVVDDEITKPLRDGIEEQMSTTSGAVWRAWDTLDTIVNCPACSSVWSGAGILMAEQTGVGRFLVRVLALSQLALAVQSVIGRIDR